MRVLIGVLLMFGCAPKNSVSAPSAAPVSSAKHVVSETPVGAELRTLKSDIHEYLQSDDNDQELKHTMAQVATVDEKTIQTAVDEKTFSKADDKTEELKKQVQDQTSTDDDKQKVEGALKGAAIYAIVIGSLAAVGASYMIVKDFKAMTTVGKIRALSRTGLTFGALILGAIILSEDKADKNEVIALGATLGVVAFVQAEGALTTMLGSKQIHTEEIKFDIRKELVSNKFKGDIYAESERVFAEAHTENTGDRMVEKARTRIQEKPSGNFTSGLIGAFMATSTALLAAQVLLLTESETPKQKVLRKIAEFWSKMKELESASI